MPFWPTYATCKVELLPSACWMLAFQESTRGVFKSGSTPDMSHRLLASQVCEAVLVRSKTGPASVHRELIVLPGIVRLKTLMSPTGFAFGPPPRTNMRIGGT